MFEFAVGDVIVYPAHGVAKVIAIEQKNIGEQKQNFYILRVLDNDVSLMVPTSNVAHGMRKIVSCEEADAAFDVLKKREKIVESTTWNRRYREYMEKIKTGSVFEVARVLRDLYVLKGDKDLSFGERKMLDTARSLFIREVSIAKGISHEEVENRFRIIFKC